MLEKFKDFNQEREYIVNILKELNDIEYILKDEGVRYLVISYPNRNFKFPGIGKDSIKKVPLKIKFSYYNLTKSEIIRSDFFNEWLDRAEEICQDMMSIYRELRFSGSSSEIIIYFYYN